LLYHIATNNTLSLHYSLPICNNAIVAGLSSFSLPGKAGASQHDQQSADLNRYPEKSRATHKKLRAKDRPLANDFLSDEVFDGMRSEEHTSELQSQSNLVCRLL